MNALKIYAVWAGVAIIFYGGYLAVEEIKENSKKIKDKLHRSGPHYYDKKNKIYYINKIQEL